MTDASPKGKFGSIGPLFDVSKLKKINFFFENVKKTRVLTTWGTHRRNSGKTNVGTKKPPNVHLSPLNFDDAVILRRFQAHFHFEEKRKKGTFEVACS